MSLIIRPGHTEIAEREFDGHPDVVSTRIAAEFVNTLASAVPDEALSSFRADVNVQIGADTRDLRDPILRNARPIRINIVGQVNAPGIFDLEPYAHEAAATVLANTGYFLHGEYAPSLLDVNIEGITPQSALLNGTSKAGYFADMCRVEGFH